MNKVVSIWSSGGVIILEGKVAVCYRKKENLFCLPKGTPENNENIEQTAIREVAEETGIIPKIVNKIGEIQYSIKQETSTKDRMILAMYMFHLISWKYNAINLDL